MLWTVLQSRSVTAKRKRSGPTIPQMVALLDNEEFRSDTIAVLEQFRLLNETALTQEEWDDRFEAHAIEHIGPFIKKWGVLPPTDRELVEDDPRNEVVNSILTGRWGVIPVFPWTSESEIKKQAARIRRAIGKIHKDAEGRRRAMIAQWIRMHPSRHGLAPRAEIAAAVWQCRKGLRRPTRAQAIRNLSLEEEERLLKHYIGLGLSHGEATRRVYKRVRGSEAHGVRMVRAAEARRAKEYHEFHRSLESPRQLDEAGYYLTMLFHEIFLTDPINTADVILQAERFRDHLLRTSVRIRGRT